MEQDDFSQLPKPEEVAKVIDAGLPGVDRMRADGLGQLGQARDAKARSLSREQTLLALKHGGTTHTRIAEAKQRFTVNEALRREVAVVRELAETPLPEPAKNAMIVHGFVRRRSDHAGLPGLTVAITDANGTWIQELGYVCTDKRGYFRLDITSRGSPGKDPQTPGDIKPPAGITVEEARREGEAKAAAGRTASGTATADTLPKEGLQLRVFDAKGNVLHTETRPVVLNVGSVDYRYILLGDNAAECACTPPPEKPGGKPSPAGPIPKPDNPPPIGVNPGATPTPSVPRVAGLKQYEPAPGKAPTPAAPAGTPLEAIRGIGPKGAAKLRRAGIADVADYEKAAGSEIVKISGFDKTPPKTPAATPKPAEPASGKSEPEKKAPPRKPKSRKSGKKGK